MTHGSLERWLPGAPVSGTDETAATTGTDSVGSPDKSPGKKESSSGTSTVSAILLAIALVIVGIWALSSNSSADEDIGSLQAENARLNSDNDRIRELESDLEAVQTDKETVTDQRDALIKAFVNLDPCSATNFGTPGGAFWTGFPELGLGCAYTKEGNTTRVVTVASGTPASYGEFIKNNGVEGYMLSSSCGNMAVYVWMAGSGAETEQKAH